MDRINHLFTEHKNVSTSYSFVAATDWAGGNRSTKITAPTPQTNMLYQIMIQKVTLSVTTDNAATQTLQSSNGTPVPVTRSKASPGLGPITWDFGTEGFALAAGENLVHEMSAAGMAGTVAIQAYARLVQVQ